MFIYIVMAFWAGIGLAFNTRLSSMMASALAPTGALFTFLALWTGALWGKPTWGAWWVWDARLTSELILLFLYLGFMALQAAIDDPRRADKAGAVLALVGVVNVPIIYFSVKWWNTLHQGASVSMTARAQHGRHHAAGHADHGAGLLDVQHRRRAGARALHHPRARTAHRNGSNMAGSGHDLAEVPMIFRHGRLWLLRLGQLPGRPPWRSWLERFLSSLRAGHLLRQSAACARTPAEENRHETTS